MRRGGGKPPNSQPRPLWEKKVFGVVVEVAGAGKKLTRLVIKTGRPVEGGGPLLGLHRACTVYYCTVHSIHFGGPPPNVFNLHKSGSTKSEEEEEDKTGKGGLFF